MTRDQGRDKGRWARRGAAALAGAISAAVALGVAELTAAPIAATASPVIAVGQEVIRATPEPVKEFAIATFGESDKIALLGGMYVLLTVFAVVVGLLAARRFRVGAAGVALFGLVGTVAAIRSSGAGPLYVLPSVVGALAGIAALFFLVRPFRTAANVVNPSTPAVGAGASPPTAAPSSPASDADQDGPREGPRERPKAGAASGSPFDRRLFLRATAITVGVAAFSGALGRYLISRRSVSAARAAIKLPKPAMPAPALPAGTELNLPGLTSFMTRPEDFYTVHTALVEPQIDPETWQLKIFGRVAKPLTLSFDDLLRRPMIERDITLSCVSVEVGGNLNATSRWLGVPLKDLLDEVQPEAGADQLVSRSFDGWTCGTPTETCRDGRDVMLAVAMDGQPLLVERGFPVRMLVPGLYGYVSATKWITEIELTTFADFDSYWTERKWDAKAPVKTFSRIDTPKPLADVKAGQTVVAGIAYRQHTGIKGVEVRVDDGPWQPATLAATPNDDTWVQWQYRWNATPGSHTLVCRATDKNGQTQPEERVAPFPGGATGWHSSVVNVA